MFSNVLADIPGKYAISPDNLSENLIHLSFNSGSSLVC